MVMRTVVANITLSLDGRTTGAGGEYDMGWLAAHATTDAARDHLIAVTKPATTVLLGKKNYEGFGGYWPSVAHDESAEPRDRAFARWLNDVEKIVFSSTLKQATWKNSSLANTDVAAFVEDLKQRGSGDILVLSSRSLIISLLEADLIDRLSIVLCPEIVGGGTRLFEDGLPSSSWSLSRNTITDRGAFCLIYDRVR
jgi:dihydrofolate reductase